jgi:uncharacterized membrane protein YbhN (UPF0104 family)
VSAISPIDVLAPEVHAEVHLKMRRLPKRWMSWATAIFLGASSIGGYIHRQLIGSAWHEAHNISAAWWLVLFAVVAFHRVLTITQHGSAVPTVSFARSALASEVDQGASNAVVGGAAIGTTLRVAMWRSWGVDPLGVVAALFVGTFIPSFALWIIAGAYSWPRLVSGNSNRTDLFVGLGALAFVLVPAIFWFFALTRRGFAAWLTGMANRIVIRISRRVSFVRRLTERHHLPELSEDVRVRSLALIRQRGLRLLVASVAAQAFMPVILLACLHAVGVGVSIDNMEILRTYAIVKIVSSFVPVPGGLGILDVGILGSLLNAGASRPQAVAALAVFRGITFFLPIVTGTAAAIVWRRRQAS